MEKHHIWYTCIILGPLTAYAAVFYPIMSILALVFFIIGAKGILLDIL